MILACSGRGCSRLISVSVVPGGNPVARNDPEHFSIEFQTCPDCHNTYCDRCVPVRGPNGPARCKGCSGRLVDGGQRHRVQSGPKAEFVRLHDRGYELGGERPPRRGARRVRRGAATAG
jgi:hypothetical protein